MEEDTDAAALINNWLAADAKVDSNRLGPAAEDFKLGVAWLKTDGKDLSAETRGELERIRLTKDQSPFTEFLTEINSRINQDVLQV